MAERYEIPQGFYGRRLNFTVTESDGTVTDLTDYTPVFKMWIPGSEALTINTECTISNATAGECFVAPADGDFDVCDRYYAEIELQATGIIESSQRFEIVVRESL